MSTLVFDIETTYIERPGHLPSTVHCGVALDVDTGEEFVAITPGDLNAFKHLLSAAGRLIGHNIARFDVPVLEAQGALFSADQEWYDTLVASNMLHGATLQERSAVFQKCGPEVQAARSALWRLSQDPDADPAEVKAAERSVFEATEARMPQRLLRSHSLEAWGYRLSMHKAWANVDRDFWTEYSPEMLERCISDVRLNAELYRWLLKTPGKPGWAVGPVEPVLHDSRVAYIIGCQERNGIGFNTAAAWVLEGQLVARRAGVVAELREAFPAWISPSGKPQTPKRSQRRQPGTKLNPREWPVYVTEGAEYQRVEVIEFNPGSTYHRAFTLHRKYGWQAPRDEKTGNPKTDEEVLQGLDYPEAKLLLDYAMVNKRLGQLSEGKFAWAKMVTEEGKIHGGVNCVGTRTSRMTHSRPNCAQIPSVKHDEETGAVLRGFDGLYGYECRQLFGPTRPGWVQVGADASGIELRLLAHRLHRFDGGEFAKTVLEGKKADGTDVHSRFMALTGMPTRDGQKEWTYATLYGAGDAKRGHIFIKHCRIAGANAPPEEKAVQIGREGKAKLLAGMPAFAYLLQACEVAHERGYVIGLDGRLIPCKSQHGVLNDLLQSDGAIVMKYALTEFWRRHGHLHGVEWAFMANVHDEWQMETTPERAEYYGAQAVDCMRWAGKHLNLTVPIDGEYDVGASWADTH